MACRPKSKDAAIRADKLIKVYKRWSENDTISALTQGQNKFWRSFYEEHTGLDFDYGSMPSATQIAKLDKKVGRMIKGLKKNPSLFAEWMYLPENILSKNPVTKNYFDSMIISGNFYRGNLEMFTSDIDLMAKMIKTAAREEGAMRYFQVNRKSAQQEIKKMEAEYKELTQKDPNMAEKYYRDHLQRLDQTEELK